MQRIQRFLRDESGATAIEYGLIAALVSVAAITALQFLGSELKNTFSTIQGALNAGTAASKLPKTE